MNELTNKQIRMACLFKAVEVLGPNRFRFTASKEVTEPFLAAAQQFYDFVTADDENADPKSAQCQPDPDFDLPSMESIINTYCKCYGIDPKRVFDRLSRKV